MTTTAPPPDEDDLGPFGAMIGSGGQAQVFELPELSLPDTPGPLVYKRYKPGQAPAARDMSKIIALRSQLVPGIDAETDWPVRQVVDSRGALLGVVMRRIPDSFMQEIQLPSGTVKTSPREVQFLFIPPDRALRGGTPTPTPTERLMICRDFADTLAFLHDELQVVVGDINARSALFRVDAGPTVMFVGCDMVRFEGQEAVGPLHAPDWDPPENSRTISKTIDLYKLGLFILRCLTPNPQSSINRDPNQARGSLDSQGMILLNDAIKGPPSVRPSAEAWYQYLRDVLGEATRRESIERLPDVISDIESVTDSLGVAGDVRTIATVLAASSTAPPLSVALLGDWGAGKSSFMCQLREQMKDLTRSSAVVGERRAFVSNLRQVTFNAWHYSDDHLWVGLIEQIFRELRAKPPESTDPALVRELTERLDRETAERDRLARELVAVQEMDSPLGKVFAPLHSWRVLRGLWSWRLLGALLIVALGVGAIALGQQLIGAVITAAGAAVALWSRVGQSVVTAREQVRDRKAALDQKIEATTGELDQLDPARRMKRLLEEITAEDRYAGFRGITGRIHHDLRRLSEDLADADHAPLQRIVLYVDDLDRCTPARVVDVLQAVNLLLTMNLFMVVVAVDPRWLLRSLERHHSGLFDAEVGPVVYLDKIFHIPFALRPMGNRAVSYLHSLLPELEEEAVAPAPETVPSQQVEQIVPEQDRRPVAVTAAPAPAQERAPALPTAEGLRVTAAERDFLGKLTPLLTTPRAIKKLTNLYRLLRLSVPKDELQDFLDGQYQVAALLLATLAGTPTEARRLLDQLTTGEDVNAATKLAAQFDVDQPAHVYRRWAAEIARFGFTTYDLYPG